MKVKKFLVAAGMLLAGILPGTVTAQESAEDILTKMDKVLFAPKDRAADLEMTMINLDNGRKKVKKAILMQKGAGKKIFIYTYPESDKGIGTLTNGSEIYLYMPLFKKPKKITNISESNTFNTSDFSLEDTPSSSYSSTYTPEMIKTDKDSWVLKLTPKSKDSSYGYLLVTVNKTHYYPEQIEYFSKSGTKTKTATYNFIKPGKYWAAKTVTMKDTKKHHSTKIVLSNIKFDQGLKDDLFTAGNLVKLADKQRAGKKQGK